MEPNQESTPPPASDSTPPPSFDKKKLLLIGGVLLLIVIMMAAAYFLTSGNSETPENANKTKSIVTDNSPSEKTPNNGEAPIQEEANPPEKVAKGFHDWYVNQPNAIKSGAYKSRNDITDEYKEIMEGYLIRGFLPGRDPVLNCGDSILPKNVIALPGEFDETRTLALVVLQEADTKRNLYQIKMAKDSVGWKVRDVWCPRSSAN